MSAGSGASTTTMPLPLFPLPLVLFPRATTQLRIFESRYLNMTRECAASGTGFGIVHFTPATQGRPARHAAIGTEALIEDFSTLEDGLLGLTVRGYRRFRVRATSARDDGLIVAAVDWLPAEPAIPVAPEYAVLQSVARELMRHEAFSAIAHIDTDNASALGMALASLLPLEPPQAQELLAVSDPNERLRALCVLLQSEEPDADRSD